MMNWKAQIRLVSRIFVATAIALLIASAILFGLAQTNWGIRELARWVSSLDRDLSVVPGKMSGVFPFRFELEQLSVADAKGVWLEARGIRVCWSPLPLIEKRIVFEELLIPSLSVDRLPMSGGQESKPFPSWIFGLRFDRLHVDELTLGSALFGESAVLRIEAEAPSTMDRQYLEASLKIERTDKPGSILQVQSAVHGETLSFKLDASFQEDRDGLLGKVLGMEGPLSLSLSGQGTPGLWQGKVVASLLPYVRMESDLEVAGPENPVLKAVGKAYPIPETILGKTVSWELHAQELHPRIIFIKSIDVSAESLHLEGSGEVRVPEAAAALESRYEIKDLRTLSSLEPLAGWSTQGKATLSWKASSPILASPIQGSLQPPAGATLPFPSRNLNYAGTLSLDNQTTLHFSGFEVSAPWATLKGDAELDLLQKSLKAAWHVVLPNLDVFSLSLKGGPSEVRATTQGPLSSLTLSADATLRDLAVSGLEVGTGRASLVAQIGAGISGNAKTDMQLKGLTWSGRTDYVWSGDRLALTGISLEAGRANLRGDLSLSLDKILAQGELKAECDDLAGLSSLIREEVQGSALLQARLFPSGEGQKAHLLMDAKNLQLRSITASQAKLEAQGTLWGGAPKGSVALEIPNGRIDDLAFSSTTLALEGDLQNASFRFASTGRFRDSFEVRSSGFLRFSPEGQRIILNQFQGRYGTAPLTLLRPVALSRSPEKIDLGEWHFTFGSGQFLGSGHVHSTDLSVDLRFEGLPVRTIPLPRLEFLDGLAHGTIRMKGTLARPEGTAELVMETLQFRDQGFPSVTLALHAALHENFVEATLLVQRVSDQPLEVHVKSPLHFSLSPPTVGFPPEGEIRGALQGEIHLQRMARLLKLNEEILTGTLSFDLAMEGPVEGPKIFGKIDLKDGSYENLKTGTLLKELQAVMTAQTTRLVVDTATATDGEGGRIDAKGWLEILPRQGLPFNLVMSLLNTKPFRYNWGTAEVSADLSLAGSLSGANLTGSIRVRSADFRIPDRLPAEITDLKVIEINKPEGLHLSAARGFTPGVWPLSLDLTLASPGRVFLAGRGLDTEWEGNVQVQGTAAQPVVTGSLSVVRGHADFLGKRFEVKKGIVFLDGSFPPSPTIDVQAESKSRSITAYLHLTGSVQAPVINLTSEPPFPPDEILARLLFGRSASNITPLQAVQLADSINTLARGGGLDLLARTRQVLGLDQLTFKETGKDQKETALAAGKYLSEEVYLEVQQGISPETGKASLKWEITPSVTVETEVGINAEAGVGINWRWDY